MLAGEMTAGFQFGVLVVADDEASEEIASWLSSEEQVTASHASVAMRVLHQQEGEVQVKVWHGRDSGSGVLVFAGMIDVPTGIVRISDVVMSQVLRVPVGKGCHRIEMYANSTVEASEISVLFDPIGPQFAD